MTKIGAAMNGGLGDRQPRDFYPTPPEATIALLRSKFAPSDRDIWEPMAGNGAISDVLHDAGHRVFSSDIHPLRDGIHRQDFFNFTAPPFFSFQSVVTNPPYEKRTPECVIRHAHQIGVRYLALLLPSTFWHAATRLPLWEFWPPSARLDLTWRPDFMGLGAPTMNFQWCIWMEGVTETRYDLLRKPLT